MGLVLGVDVVHGFHGDRINSAIGNSSSSINIKMTTPKLSVQAFLRPVDLHSHSNVGVSTLIPFDAVFKRTHMHDGSASRIEHPLIKER